MPLSSGERTSEWISMSAPQAISTRGTKHFQVAGLERQHKLVGVLDPPAPHARIKLQDLSLDAIMLGCSEEWNWTRAPMDSSSSSLPPSVHLPSAVTLSAH